MTSIFKHIEKLEMGYFLVQNKFYLKLTTDQENSETSEQRKTKYWLKNFIFTMILNVKSVILSSKMNYKNS